MTRLIKKYKNRKYYDVKTASYISLTDLKDFILQGEVVKVIVNSTKQDITLPVLFNVASNVSEGLPFDEAKVKFLHLLIKTSLSQDNALQE